MDRRILASIVIAVILVVVGGYFVMSNKTPKSETPIVANENQPQPTLASTQPMSIKELLTSNGSQKCTFSNNTTGFTSSGLVYVSNSKMRGDFDSMVNGTTTKSHMIVDDKTSYIWTDGQTQGFKMSLDTMPSPNANTTQTNVDVNQKLDYKCEIWSADNSVFTLPTNIKFQDLSTMMGLPNKSPNASGTTNGNSAQCAACESLSGDSKTQCLKALSCN